MQSQHGNRWPLRAAVTALRVGHGINLITIDLPENTVYDTESVCYSFAFIPDQIKSDNNAIWKFCHLVSS